MIKHLLTALFLLTISLAEAQAQEQNKQKVELSINLSTRSGGAGGGLSVSVCDADAVSRDSIQPNAVAQLLLCSEIRGRIENPNHYFDNPTAQTNAELDLLMMTQGWSRYDIENIMNEEYPQIDYSIETLQTISGFPKIKPLSTVHRQPIAEKFVEQSTNLHNVNDIHNMQYLDEVVVVGKRILNPLGFKPDNILSEGDYWLEHSAVSKLVAQRVGLQVSGADGMEQIIGRFRHKPNGKMEMKPCLIIIDDFKATQEEFLRLPAENIRQVELFKDNTTIPMVYGFPDDFPYQTYSRTGEFDCLLVYTKPIAKTENKDVYSYPDYRTTLYWNPAMQSDENGNIKISFYNSDTAKRYLVTVEGVADNGEIVSETKIIEK